MKNNKIKKCIENIFNCILNILLIIITILIIIGIYYIFQIKIQNKNYANMFGYTFFEVATGSMSPTIEIGDVVIVKITKDVKENDIIVYNEGKSFVTHRLIKINQDKIIAKGDANNTEDKPITQENILGKVTKIIPNLGTWRKVILTPEVIGLIIILMTICSLLFIYNSKTEEKNEK